MRIIILMLAVLCLLCTSIVRADDAAKKPSSTATTPAEAKLGKEICSEIEKGCKLVKDDKAVAKLEAIAADIAPHTQRPDVVYHCKIIDSPELNAESIPGGTVYFTSGILKAVESDDELAAIMAHEMAHNSLYHVKKKMEQEKKANYLQVAELLAVILSTSEMKTDAENGSREQELLLSQVVKESILNGYSKEIETQADLNGIQYLYDTKKYDPVGMYSVISGFKEIENTHAPQDMGYLLDHPASEERLAAIKQKLDELHVPINIWNVVNFRASIAPPDKITPGYTVKLGSIDVVTFSVADDTKDAQTRATAAVNAINKALTMRADALTRFDAQSIVNKDNTCAYVRLRSTTVMVLIPADVKAMNMDSLDDLAALVRQNIQTAFFNERVKRGI